MRRFRIDLGTQEVTSEQLAEEGLELPRINYGRSNERPYRYAWGIDAKSGWLDRIVKVDARGAQRPSNGTRTAAARVSPCSSRPR